MTWPRPFKPLAVGLAWFLGSASILFIWPVLDLSGGWGVFLLVISAFGAYVLAPVFVARTAKREGLKAASVQTAVYILIGVLVAVPFLYLPEDLTTSPGEVLTFPALLGIMLSIALPALLISTLIAEVVANRRSDTPTAIGRARDVPFLSLIGWWFGAAVVFLVVTGFGFWASDVLFGRIGEPFVTGSFMLAYVGLPYLVTRLRPGGSFEGDALLVVWSAVLAAGLAAWAWWGLDWVNELRMGMLGTGPHQIGLPEPYLFFLAPGLLVSFSVLRWLHARRSPSPESPRAPTGA